MTKRASQSILGTLTLSDDIIATVSRLSDAGQVNPVRVGRKLVAIVGIMLASLIILCIACTLIWKISGLSEEGQMALALIAALSVVVFAASVMALLANVMQALIFQYLAISEKTLEIAEAEEEREEVVGELIQVRRAVNAVSDEQSPTQLRNAINQIRNILNRPPPPQGLPRSLSTG